MQSFTGFDIVIVSLTVLIGLKGLFRGFTREVFGLVGIIGGIFVASRLSLEIGTKIAPLLSLENNATIKLVGFIVGLVGFWAIVYVLGVVISKIFLMSGLGVFDRILGFVFGSAKMFFIFSIIAYSLYQIQSFKDLMDDKTANSTTFPLLIKTGSFIVKLDASDFVKKVEDSVSTEEKVEEDPDLAEKKSITNEIKQTVKEIKDATVESTNAVIQSAKKGVVEELTKSNDSEETPSNAETKAE
ncbi:colicin V synthesis protein [Halarcobacter ebronensis]|uniref:Colicin V synthesis protein n=1 Tax=Halarcobacter ebronensis TaxID=1462615 RepID=A0A4Q0Y5A8_9BACT|nr:CvpA family protein [Halarcobacter ebronensis]RXJ65352.1 colicin V synthesis protein [Halarcobacter ebronensis]